MCLSQVFVIVTYGMACLWICALDFHIVVSSVQILLYLYFLYGWTMIALISLFKEDRKIAKIRDIFGIIKGYEEPDRYVILGNHRDAWTYGAVDPNSGTAALLDIARRLGIMLQSGWKPRRSVILCSWDAEEFGMVS